MSPETLLAELDKIVTASPPEGRLSIAVMLAARIAMIAAEAAGAPPRTDVNLSVEEAAQRLGVSIRYLYNHSRQLPFTVKVGSRLLFSAEGLEKWVRSRRGTR